MLTAGGITELGPINPRQPPHPGAPSFITSKKNVFSNRGKIDRNTNEYLFMNMNTYLAFYRVILSMTFP